MIQHLAVTLNTEATYWFILGPLYTWMQKKYMLSENDKFLILCAESITEQNTAHVGEEDEKEEEEKEEEEGENINAKTTQ